MKQSAPKQHTPSPAKAAQPGKPRPKGFRRVLRILLKLTLWFFVSTMFTAVLFRFINPPATPLMFIRLLEGIVDGRSVGMTRQWRSLEEITPSMLRSVIAAEDARFFEHNGIDWDAVERAREHNEATDGERLQGASTITMQCARNVFLWQGRNYIRKGLEVYFTYLIELVWGKRRILEVYLNVIEWGDGIYGVNAAAAKYFGVSPARLGPHQAALLASILPNPRVFSPVNPTPRISRKAAIVAERAGMVNLSPLK